MHCPGVAALQEVWRDLGCTLSMMVTYGHVVDFLGGLMWLAWLQVPAATAFNMCVHWLLSAASCVQPGLVTDCRCKLVAYLLQHVAANGFWIALLEVLISPQSLQHGSLDADNGSGLLHMVQPECTYSTGSTVATGIIQSMMIIHVSANSPATRPSKHRDKLVTGVDDQCRVRGLVARLHLIVSFHGAYGCIISDLQRIRLNQQSDIPRTAMSACMVPLTWSLVSCTPGKLAPELASSPSSVVLQSVLCSITTLL